MLNPRWLFCPALSGCKAARPVEVPYVDMGKYEDFVGVVSKTGTFLKPTQQWNFSFFLFSAKRGGTSPNVQGRLSCWLINQKMSPLGWIFPPFTKYLDACIIRLTEICWWESGWRYDVIHVQIFSVSHHGSLSCGSCARSHVVIIYTWRGATKMATKDIDCPTINHHYKGVISFSQTVSQIHHSYENQG